MFPPCPHLFSTAVGAGGLPVQLFVGLLGVAGPPIMSDSGCWFLGQFLLVFPWWHRCPRCVCCNCVGTLSGGWAGLYLQPVMQPCLLPTLWWDWQGYSVPKSWVWGLAGWFAVFCQMCSEAEKRSCWTSFTLFGSRFCGVQLTSWEINNLRIWSWGQMKNSSQLLLVYAQANISLLHSSMWS